MTDLEPSSFLTVERRRLIDDIIIHMHAAGPWVLSDGTRTALIGLLRKLIAEPNWLRLYCKILNERRASIASSGMQESVIDKVLGNELESLNDDALVQLVSDPEGLEAVQEMVAEELDGPWAEVIADEGIEVLKASGVQVPGPEHLLHQLFGDRGGHLRYAAQMELYGSFLTVRSSSGDASDLRSEADVVSQSQSEVSSPVTRWRLATGDPRTYHIPLPHETSLRCFGLDLATVEVLLLAHTIDRQGGTATLRASIFPGPPIDGFEMTMYLTDENPVRFAFPRRDSGTVAVFSAPSDPIKLHALTTAVLKIQLSFL